MVNKCRFSKENVIQIVPGDKATKSLGFLY